MPSVRVSRRYAAPLEDVWALLDDAYHLARWWPGVNRIEAVTGDRFTQVMLTKKGRAMRVDFRVLESQPQRLRTWALEPEGTPFERVVASWETTVLLDGDADGTTVTIEERQQMRGTLRLAAYMQRRTVKKRLKGALDGLTEIFG